jgi:hypothetical protein
MLPEVGTKWFYPTQKIAYQVVGYLPESEQVTVLNLQNGGELNWQLLRNGDWFSDIPLTPLMEALL